MIRRGENKQEQHVDISLQSVQNICNSSSHGSNTRGEYTIEQHLMSFSETMPYRVLWASWIMEKEQYRLRLKTIANTFPTYSSHADDHSEEILERIEAILGEDRIRLLSPTDAWLLLQCAYTHDLGMCVKNDEKTETLDSALSNSGDLEKLFDDNDFKEYLFATDSLMNNSTSPHNDPMASSVRFVLRIVRGEDKEAREKVVNHLKQLSYSKAGAMFSTVVASYFRKRHAERTRDILIEEAQTDTSEVLIPIRLRKMVARIDYCHGGPWKSSIDELPYKDNGIHTDYVHPKFIAALLRLGDLLDLDSNRFNPYQLDMVGILPASSIVHVMKHRAITELLVTPREINIEARFVHREMRKILDKYFFSSFSQERKTEDEKEQETWKLIDRAAKSLLEWINMIRLDLQIFSAEWNFVVPEDMPGYLAALKKNEVYVGTLSDPVDIDDINLKYAISPSRASQLMIGTDLYESPWAFVREIAQNSIDATKKFVARYISELADGYPAWSLDGSAGDNDLGTTESDEISGSENGSTGTAHSPYQRLNRYFNAAFSRDIVGRFPVTVHIHFYPQGGKYAYSRIKFSFVDSGIGITYGKLKQMRRIGDIVKTKEERQLIEDMPEWLKPTGEFGIGMQSIFAYADEFRITTYPRGETGQNATGKRTIQFHCPELGGDIIAQNQIKQPYEKDRYGTALEFEILLNESNTRKLLSIDLVSVDKRSFEVVSCEGIFRALQQYIQNTFTNDVIPLEFRFFQHKSANAKSKATPIHVDGCDFPGLYMLEYQNAKSDHNYLAMPNGIDHFKETNQFESGKLDEHTKAFFWYNSIDTKKDKEGRKIQRIKDSVLLGFERDSDSHGEMHLYYKGIAIHHDDNQKQDAIDSLLRFCKITGIRLHVNLLSQNAGTYLELNRDRLRPEGYLHIKSLIAEAMVAFFEKSICVFKQKDLRVRGFWREQTTLQTMLLTVYSVMRPEELASVEKLLGDCCIEQFHIEMIACSDGKVSSPYVPFSDSVLENTWFSDYVIQMTKPKEEVISPPPEDFVAIKDYISDLCDLSYSEVKAFKSKEWNEKCAMVYRLSKRFEDYPKINDESYRTLCKITVQKYLARYREYKKRGINPKNISNWGLVFPALKEYACIAVDKIPVEAPGELAKRFHHFVICPCTVHDLYDWTEKYANSPEQYTNVSWESLLAEHSKEIDQYITEHIYPVLKNEISTEQLLQEYHKYLSFLG